MRIKSLPLLPLLILILLPLSSYSAAATATGPKANFPASVDIYVSRGVQVQSGGLVVINDTVSLFAKPGEEVGPLQSFLIGFPYEYGASLDYGFAHEASNPDKLLNLEFDVGLGGRIGFYGVSVDLSSVELSGGESYNFTATFVFSNLVSPEAKDVFKLDFPLYPSLTEEASACSVTVALPSKAMYKDGSHAFNQTTLDSQRIISHVKAPLKAFAKETAWITFRDTAFLLIEGSEVEREITWDEWGRIQISDSYRFINKAAEELREIKLRLPRGAYGVSLRDALGGVGSQEKNATTYTNATVSLKPTIMEGEVGTFTVVYWLPREGYVNHHGWWDFTLTFTFFERFSWTIRRLTVTVRLPEGAEFVSELSSANLDLVVQRDVFQEAVTFTLYNVTPFHALNFSVTYRHLIFWASFRPTLWMGLLIAFAGVIVLLRRAPQPPVSVIAVPPETLRSFVEMYAGKERLLIELEAMERQARKGKIPRRRYRVRRRTLAARLSTLSRNLTDLQEEIRAAGPRYADMMRGIEVAETDLQTVKEDIQRIRVRYRRKQLSSGAYRKLLEEYRRREERARTTIDGLLLRLREEIP